MISKKRKGATQKRSGGSGIASLLWMFFGSVLTLMIGLFLYLWNPFGMGDAEQVAQEREVQPLSHTDSANGEYEFYDLLPSQEITSIPDEDVNAEDNSGLTEQQRALQEALLEPDVIVTGTGEDEAGVNDIDTEATEVRVQDASSNADTDLSAVNADSDSSRIGNGIDDNYVTDNGSSLNNHENRQNQNQSQGDDEGDIAIEAATPNISYILQINSFSSAEEADVRRAQVLMAGVDARVVRKTMDNGQTFYQVVSPPVYNRQAVVAAQQRLQNNGIDSLIVEQRRQ